MSSNSRAQGMSDFGPGDGVMWVEDGSRNRAKQSEMLEIDIEFSGQWVEIMQKMVARELSDHEFTLERMTALHEWERQRKRAQKNLHYKYDLVKRKQYLVERDVKRQLAKARKVLDERGARLKEQFAALSARLEAPVAAVEPPPRQKHAPAPKQAPVSHPGLATMNEPTYAMVKADLTGIDVETAADEDILYAYSQIGFPPDAAQFYLNMINGVPEG